MSKPHYLTDEEYQRFLEEQREKDEGWGWGKTILVGATITAVTIATVAVAPRALDAMGFEEAGQSVQAFNDGVVDKAGDVWQKAKGVGQELKYKLTDSDGTDRAEDELVAGVQNEGIRKGMKNPVHEEVALNTAANRTKDFYSEQGVEMDPEMAERIAISRRAAINNGEIALQETHTVAVDPDGTILAQDNLLNEARRTRHEQGLTPLTDNSAMNEIAEETKAKYAEKGVELDNQTAERIAVGHRAQENSMRLEKVDAAELGEYTPSPPVAAAPAKSGPSRAA